MDNWDLGKKGGQEDEDYRDKLGSVKILRKGIK
jgi:hypothetical protein